ncbi:hypothetical protein LOAG_16797 [Loa loa]|uniref:Uncharacterized protein n=1 Tax=Loa loa TaxID=7209 RepID=A0A1I7W0A3_LOALO|nr:hypothetical protein LOAG_16797 [Loa loa]EJD76194.1 hypothetical protein LOAG_16797 [Loa loa]
MLDAFYGYFFGSEDVNGNNTKENVAVLTNSTELVACTLPSRSSETKDDDWILLDGQLSSGRSTPVIIPEPDLIAIDDELSAVITESLRPLSPASTLPHNDVLLQEPVRCDCTRDLSRGSRSGISGKHVERMRQAKQKAIEKKELERKLFENQLLGISSDADKKYSNTIINNSANNKTLNMLNNAAKMKRSTAAGHFATDSKTKPRSKKTNRLLAGRNNDRKVNTLN